MTFSTIIILSLYTSAFLYSIYVVCDFVKNKYRAKHNPPLWMQVRKDLENPKQWIVRGSGGDIRFYNAKDGYSLTIKDSSVMVLLFDGEEEGYRFTGYGHKKLSITLRNNILKMNRLHSDGTLYTKEEAGNG